MEKNLKEQISEGIYEGTMKVIVTLIWIVAIATIVIVLVLLGIKFYGDYQEHQFEKANCGGQPCPVGNAVQNNCNYPFVSCQIYTTDLDKILVSKEFCGYQEAESYFQIFKNDKNGLFNNRINDTSKLNLWCAI